MKLTLQLGAVILLVLAGTGARAESQAQRQACENDAFRVCRAAIPDRHNVFLCLMANRHNLSPACRAVMAEYSRPGSRHDEAATRRSTTTGSGSYAR